MESNYNSQMTIAHILLAHGSRDPGWRKPFEELLEKCKKGSPQKKFCLSYLELCNPKLSDVVKDLLVNNQKITTFNIHPLFLSSGVHVNDDIQKILSDLRTNYPQKIFNLNDVIGNNILVTNAIYKVVSS